MSFRDRLNNWAKDDQGETNLGRFLLPLAVLMSLLSFLFIGSMLDLKDDLIQSWMTWAAANPLSLLVVIAVYVVLGLIGTPQFLLLAMTGAVLPPFQAFAYGWTATMISATLHFFIGRQFSDWIRAASGKRLRRLKQIMSRNGIVASAILRNVPAGPFIFVNVVCGASGMRGHHYLMGTGVGIIPKAGALIFLGINLGTFIREPSLQGFAIIAAVIAGVALISTGLARVLAKFEKASPNTD